MAQTKKFKSNTGSPVHIYRPDSPDVIEVPYYAPHYETSDKTEIAALKASPEVDEVKTKRKK